VLRAFLERWGPYLFIGEVWGWCRRDGVLGRHEKWLEMREGGEKTAALAVLVVDRQCIGGQGAGFDAIGLDVWFVSQVGAIRECHLRCAACSCLQITCRRRCRDRISLFGTECTSTGKRLAIDMTAR